MIAKLIGFSIRQRGAVLIAVLAIAALGVWNYGRLTIDAVPDITNVQLQTSSLTKGSKYRLRKDFLLQSR